MFHKGKLVDKGQGVQDILNEEERLSKARPSEGPGHPSQISRPWSTADPHGGKARSTSRSCVKQWEERRRCSWWRQHPPTVASRPGSGGHSRYAIVPYRLQQMGQGRLVLRGCC